MTFEVRIDREPRRYLSRLDRTSQERLNRRIQEIAADPFSLHSKPLTNFPGRRTSRVGGWRIIFSVNLDDAYIQILAIRPRGQVYRDIRQPRREAAGQHPTISPWSNDFSQSRTIS
jgi:mRNA interferase RelE/StbE